MNQRQTRRRINTATKAHLLRRQHIEDTVAGIPDIILKRMQSGCKAYQLRIMFNRTLPSGRTWVENMQDDIAAFHNNLSARSLGGYQHSDKQPTLWAAPDIVQSAKGKRIGKVVIEEAHLNVLYYYAVLLVPEAIRLKMPPDDSLYQYCQPGSSIARIDCEAVDDAKTSVSYVVKWLQHFPGSDALILLPEPRLHAVSQK